MSNLKHAFNLPINSENQDFVKFPYLPFQRIPEHTELIDPSLLTRSRCFDIKYGAKNCFAPIYVQNDKK